MLQENQMQNQLTPEMLDTLKRAAETLATARQYFPKSIRNSNTFSLELTIAAINTELHKAKGQA